MKRNIKLIIRYDGSRYFGWEHQPDREMTIQGKIERVAAKMLDMPEGEVPEVTGAGRTDAGVHARAMVANIHADTDLTEEEILEYLNRYLPDDIGVTRVVFASERFHARYNATGKCYMYRLYCGRSKPVFDRKYVTVLDEKPDVQAMKEAAQVLVGTHDFKSFCANARLKKSTVRTVDRIDIMEKGDEIRLVFHGNGFLQNMVRIMVGTLLEAGYGRMSADDVARIMEEGDRKKAGPTAPPQGLCLMSVDY